MNITNEDPDVAHPKMDEIRHLWRVQRVGWWIMLALFVAVMLGFLGGDGLFSGDTRTNADGVEAQYSRFLHVLDPTGLQIRVPAALAQDGSLQVWIESSYLRQMELQNINPEPEAVETNGQQVIFTFNAPQPGNPITVMLDVTPRQIGMVNVALGVVNGGSLHLTQLVYP